jgi:hypothetical protein
MNCKQDLRPRILSHVTWLDECTYDQEIWGYDGQDPCKMHQYEVEHLIMTSGCEHRLDE